MDLRKWVRLNIHWWIYLKICPLAQGENPETVLDVSPETETVDSAQETCSYGSKCLTKITDSTYPGTAAKNSSRAKTETSLWPEWGNSTFQKKPPTWNKRIRMKGGGTALRQLRNQQGGSQWWCTWFDWWWCWKTIWRADQCPVLVFHKKKERGLFRLLTNYCKSRKIGYTSHDGFSRFGRVSFLKRYKKTN